MEKLLQEFSNICRFCSNYHETLKPLFKDDAEIVKEYCLTTKTSPHIKILKITEILFGIKMNISDGLPKFICIICYDKLISSYEFRQQCLLSMKNIQQKLHDNKQKQMVKQNQNQNKNLFLNEDIVYVNENLNDTQITIESKNHEIQSSVVRRRNTKPKTTVSARKYNSLENSKNSRKQILPLRVCQICGVTHNRMNAHMERMHSIDGPFECDFCGKIFKAKSYLKVHFRIHLNIRNQKCKICDKAFVARTSLRVHMLNHTNERKFKCKICEKSFRQSSGLGRHMFMHNKERNFFCNFCDQRFLTDRCRKGHEILHTNENPFKCEFCTKVFKSSGTLSLHRFNVHTKLNPYKCEICNETFVKLVDFNTHKRQHVYKII